MKISVIIVNYNVKYFLEVCLHSVLRATNGFAAEVIVVDNNSTDGSMQMVAEKFPTVIRIENKDNAGFGRANNQGVAIAKGEYILFLNPDTVMPEDFFTKTIGFMDAHPEAGSIGPKLLDGKGQFAPDGKKSFPSLSVAIFKTTGINKVFSKSPYFNKYYAVHIGEDETAAVDVLSGCCMLVRTAVLPKIGGAFDEDYFMYCEDVDLSYRIQKAGYQNIYFPEATLIHYKGESTRKATLSYVRIFNEALSTFVRKHYSKGNAQLFTIFINIGIVLRAILGVVKQVLKVLRMPMFDALIMLGTLWFMKEFWVVHVKNIEPIPLNSVLATFPVYIALWVVSLYINGVYDQSYRGLRVIRAMVIGTIMILAYYGLLQPGLRYSRAIIIFSGISGTVIMLALHELFFRLGIFKFIPYDKLPRKAVIVADEKNYADTANTLRRVHYAPDLNGRIATENNKGTALAGINELKPYLFTAGINEVIFCVNGLSYAQILQQMQYCGGAYEYKIHLQGSESFVGSNSSHTAGDLYTLDKRYNLSKFSQQRNKRILDAGLSVIFLIMWPLLLLFVKNGLQFWLNCILVLTGRNTWVGYTTNNSQLPAIRAGILPPYFIAADYEPSETVARQLDSIYAQQYTAGADLTLILKNFKYLGINSKKILQK
ncbi:MAG: glycosyltransferase [Chitinophagales bacterium]|nr:glycosyltransferase [Chitinophagales bacterium]